MADAFVAALETWPRDGIPANPGAWITTTARNRALDRLRRARRHAEKLVEIERGLVAAGTESIVRLGSESRLADDRLRLIFTCCHPALALDARVALTLRTLGGLTTPEIARAFLVPEATLAQRIVRAKKKIRDAGIPYRVPPDDLLPERLDGVLAVLYLVFNEGYSATSRRRARPARAVRRGDPAGPPPGRAHAGRARGTCPARAPPPAGLAPGRADRAGRRARAARGPGSDALGCRGDRGGAGAGGGGFRGAAGRRPCRGRTSSRRRSPRATAAARAAADDAVGARSPPSTACSRSLPRGPSWS